MATVAQKLARRSGDLVRLTLALPLSVTATANTDFAFALPGGARDVAFRTKTAVAFGAATDAQLQVGSTVGGAEYVAGVSIKALGQVVHALVGAGVGLLETVAGAPGTQTTFTARIVQTGAASATGAATLFVDYALPVS
jgi:hypothetical protein